MKRLLATCGPENRRSAPPGEMSRLFSCMGGLEKVVFPERRRQAGLLLDEAGAVQPTCKLLAAQSEEKNCNAQRFGNGDHRYHFQGPKFYEL